MSPSLIRPPFNPQPFKGDSDQVRSWNDLVRLLNKRSRNEYTIALPLEDAVLPGRSPEGYKHCGTLGSSAPQYVCGAPNCTVLGTALLSKDVIRMVPFVVDHGYRVTEIAFHVSALGAAGSVARCGIYRASDSIYGSLYPVSLVFDGGEQTTTTTGVKATTCNVDLSPGFYFAAYVCGVNAPTVYAMAAGGMSQNLGTVNGVYTTHLTLSQAYGAFPTTFPSGATQATTAPPAVYLTYSQPSGYRQTQRRVAGLPPFPGDYTLRRVRLVKATAMARTQTNSRGVQIRAFLTTQGAATSSDVKVGYWDSDDSALLASFPKTISESENLDLPITEGQTLQVETTYRGWGPIPMRDTTVLFDIGTL